MKIAVLMTCHNRRDLTLRCLRSLCDNEESATHDENLRVDVFLNDDGSADGTGKAVKEWGDAASARSSFLTVRLLRGSGADYWARGMERAWRAAGDGYDHYLWLNDDLVLRPDAIVTLLRCSREHPTAVVNGTLANAAGEPIYGLNVRNTGLAGNCVLVPRKICEKVGMICGRFAHAWADRDYGLRVEKAGFGLVSAGVVGTTEWHHHRPSLRGLSLAARLAMLRDPKGWNVHDLWLLRWRNWNAFHAAASCLHLIAHVIMAERN